jgi:hypothetical protein
MFSNDFRIAGAGASRPVPLRGTKQQILIIEDEAGPSNIIWFILKACGAMTGSCNLLVVPAKCAWGDET